MTSQAEGQPLACYTGTVRVHLRIRSHHIKSTLGGKLAIYEHSLIFSGSGIRRLELRDYIISADDVGAISALPETVVPRWLHLLPVRRYGIRILSKPGGAFGDRDEYSIRFDNPNLSTVLTTLRETGYPVESDHA